MDSEKNIEQLLEKYWNCETSLEEEKQLRDYFGGGEFPKQWQETGELFRYFELQKKASLEGADFDAEIIRKIRQSEPRGKTVRMLAYAGRIAAGVVVVAAATFLVRKEIRKSFPPELADTYSDPKMALEETRKAFLMISKSFNKAETEVKKINLLNEAEEKISGDRSGKKQQDSI